MAIMQALMVPLMMATLALVVGSQITGVGRELGSLLAVVPLYAAFLLVMVPLGMLAANAARLDVAANRPDLAHSPGHGITLGLDLRAGSPGACQGPAKLSCCRELCRGGHRVLRDGR